MHSNAVNEARSAELAIVRVKMSRCNRVIDLRSDTLTLPTDEMRKAMASAEVGDDVFGEDPTVNELERIAAEMFRKEAALFVPSGTMGNLISAMSHCRERGSLIYVGDQSHMLGWEQGGVAQFGGICPRSLKTRPDGSFDVAELLRIHRTGSDYHHPKPQMVAVENPIAGKVLPLSYMKEVHDAARSIGLKIHLDGARIGNAVAHIGCQPHELTEWVDSASICLSKGLGAPVGTVIVGSKEFISRARRTRKALGGGMRQCGILAAAGIIALTKMMSRMKEDHDNAKKFAKGLIDEKIFDVDMEDVQTNMVVFKLKETVKCHVDEFLRLMSEPVQSNGASVKMLTLGVLIRAVFYNGISSDDVDIALKKLKVVCQDITEMK